MKEMIRNRKALAIGFNAFLIAALPVFEYANTALPQLQAYLPPNVYRTVGLIAVVANILLHMYQVGKKAVEKEEASHAESAKS